MNIVIQGLQVLIAVVLLVVWTVNVNRATRFRGGDARNINEEFEVYGLPPWSVYVVGGLKILAALGLIVGLFVPAFVFPAALVVVVLMAGAVTMHLKVRDDALRTFPAALMLVCSLAVLVSSLPG